MFAPNYRRKVLQRSQKGNHGETPRIAPVVLTSDGEYATIEAVRPIHYKTPQTTYNFEVEGFHTYYVGTGVLVHNMNGGGCGKHGNSLDTDKPTEGYALRDSNDQVLKYGETTRGKRRYTDKYLKSQGAHMDVMARGTKREMHTWQHEMIIEYTKKHGKRPPLNKSDW